MKYGIDREFYIEVEGEFQREIDLMFICIFPDTSIKTSIVIHEIEFYLEKELPFVWT